jgi:ubiquinone/menaquinone biosynthesis C-methylase UbiE
MEPVAAAPPDAYRGAAAAWADGPAPLYDRLASIAIDGVAEQLRNQVVLDVGAGTGALCRALRKAGATPVALDMSCDMLGFVGHAAALSIAGDMRALPFPGGRFDAAVSGFAISHIDAPHEALREMRRVVRAHGSVVVVVFGAMRAAASKDAVDEVARAYGYRPPDWYVHLKTDTEPRSNTPALLAACAESAGLEAIDVADVIVDSGLETPEAIAAYRTGLAHLAPFVASLADERRNEFIDQAVAAVRERGQPVRPRILVLSSRVPA